MKEKKARVFTWIYFRESLLIHENQSSRKFIHCSKAAPLPSQIFLISLKMGKVIALTFCNFQFLSFCHIFVKFHAYITVWSKVMNILSHLPGSFQYFQLLWKGVNIKLQQFVTIFCWNIYHQACRCLFCLFTFWEEKKCSPVFNPWLSQGIYLHHSNPIVLKIPCAKFYASSCCQTKVKVEGQFFPPSLPPLILWTLSNISGTLHHHKQKGSFRISDERCYRLGRLPGRHFNSLNRNEVCSCIISENNKNGMTITCKNFIMQNWAEISSRIGQTELKFWSYVNELKVVM